HLAAYCKEQGVELVLYRSVSTTWTRTNSRDAAALAEELGLEFIDFNAIYDEVGIDPDQDIYDEAHINYFGSVKISAYLGQYLEDRFGFTDKRADAAYSRWHEDYNRMMTNMEKYPGYIENKE
ncbi:MAG: hypothetical protein HUJ75_06025, partial [Parasporobacterium sp.]|nr:hypothetical protein [Parasporobacterium sp.]